MSDDGNPTSFRSAPAYLCVGGQLRSEHERAGRGRLIAVFLGGMCDAVKASGNRSRFLSLRFFVRIDLSDV